MFTTSRLLERRTRLSNSDRGALRLEGLAALSADAGHGSAPSRSYYLAVNLEVEATDAKRFVAAGIELLDTFENAGLRLEASAWRTSGDPISVTNYWDLGSDADGLLEAELALPDVPTFNSFNRLIAHEVKAIAIPISRTMRVAMPAQYEREKLRYLHVTMTVASDVLHEFGIRIDNYITAFTRAQGWYLGDTYYATTGPAGAISQLWVVPADLDAAMISEKLKSAPWLQDDVVGGARRGREASTPTSFEILHPTPADPVLGDRRPRLPLK